MKKEVKEDDFVSTIRTGYGAAKPESGLEVKRLKYAMRKLCVILDNSLNDLEVKYGLETGFVLGEKVSSILGDPLYHTRSSRG